MSSKPFFLRGEIPGYRHTQVAEIHLGTLLVKGDIYIQPCGKGKEIQPCGKGKEIWQVAHQYNNPYGKREKGTNIPSHHMAGRQDPTGKQRPSPSGQRPSPARDTNLGHQGEWAVVKETSHTQGKQPVHQGCMVITKSNICSHSLNRWKERPALQHRHAGMSTGSEPYTLRGILSKGA